MNNTDEFLYTDIALQMFSTFANANENEPDENKAILETLFESLQSDYGDNPFFMPALIYAFMTHMNIVFHEIAEANNSDINEIRSEYIQHYNLNVRPLLSENISNKPSMHKEIMSLINLQEELEEGN